MKKAVKKEKIKLVEQHVYKPSSPDYAELDKVCFLSKNLYNATLYVARQIFFKTGKFGRYNEINKEFTHSGQVDYCALPRKVSKMTQMLVDQNIRSYLGLVSAYNKGRIANRPGFPDYLKKDGRQVVTYSRQAISLVRKGFVGLSGTSVSVPTKQENVTFVRVVPSKTNKNIIVEVGYELVVPPVMDGTVAGGDMGINNLLSVIFPDRSPIIYSGKPLKSINQFYNKRLASLREKQDKSGSPRKTTRRMRRLHTKRNNKIKDYMHKVSREITNQLVSSGVSTFVIGYNKGWKQDVNLGKRTNQNFVQLPFLMLVNMLKYKCALAGIRVVLRDEAYTSKCSFLDDEPVEKQTQYKGRRKHRGLFVSSNGRKINADINSAGNILKKHLIEEEAWTADLHRNYVEACSGPTVYTVKL